MKNHTSLRKETGTLSLWICCLTQTKDLISLISNNSSRKHCKKEARRDLANKVSNKLGERRLDLCRGSGELPSSVSNYSCCTSSYDYTSTSLSLNNFGDWKTSAWACINWQVKLWVTLRGRVITVDPCWRLLNLLEHRTMQMQGTN